jgi:hypothetical protein
MPYSGIHYAYPPYAWQCGSRSNRQDLRIQGTSTRNSEFGVYIILHTEFCTTVGISQVSEIQCVLVVLQNPVQVPSAMSGFVVPGTMYYR